MKNKDAILTINIILGIITMIMLEDYIDKNYGRYVFTRSIDRLLIIVIPAAILLIIGEIINLFGGRFKKLAKNNELICMWIWNVYFIAFIVLFKFCPPFVEIIDIVIKWILH